MLAPLDNGTIFKTAFTDKIVFKQFVKDILGIDIEVDKIETEKKFEPRVGNIDISLDIFAESIDQRVIIEILRIDYDYNFDRFLHYFTMAIAQQQQSALEYKIDKTVYTIVVLTAPYKLDDKSQRTIRDEVLITSMDPRNLADRVVPIYGHKLVFLNHHYRNDNTPGNYRDWLDLFYESIQNPGNYKVNLENAGVKKAVELIDYDKLDPATVHLMKVDAQRKVTYRLDLEEGIKKEKIEIALKMKKKGMDRTLISEITGLSNEELEKL